MHYGAFEEAFQILSPSLITINSWSRSGKFLASGSDDTYVNIHTYLPDDPTSQFQHSISILTGHTQNIFSVKFMPYSGDRTVVTAAGDSEVRIFDIEYSGASTRVPQCFNRPVRVNGSNSFPRNQTDYYLTGSSTNCRVYRSHGDRVKRIVVESSPYLFLTCSEDGEVRQWDLRQPSSAYPAPSGTLSGDANNVPSPLISYKKYRLDLNTISCSPSQPHYIALGGAHLHCFLHDRRMTGRDLLAERGKTPTLSHSVSDHDDELVSEATRCVRKFAPNGKKQMKRHDSGHITACKISDANPNELIVSWSGDYIYSFDVIHSPGAGESVEAVESETTKSAGKKRKHDRDRKRKRDEAGSSKSHEAINKLGSVLEGESETTEDLSLRIQYENGQSEIVPIDRPRPRDPSIEAREAHLPESKRESYIIARTVVKLQQLIFLSPLQSGPATIFSSDPSSASSSIIRKAARQLRNIDELIRTWKYPVNPLRIDVQFQTELRKNRASSRRFVQACGTLARVLAGKTTPDGSIDASTLSCFAEIVPAPNETPDLQQREAFYYDFLRAILLWLESGIGSLVRSFTRPPNPPRNASRFPIPEAESSVDAIDDYLIPYLLQLAGDEPIINLDVSRFERDENRTLFPSEKRAVVAFAQALKIPFEDLSGAVIPVSRSAGSQDIVGQDRKTALNFWGYKVGRGILLNAGKGVDFEFVDRAFGGTGVPSASIRDEELTLARHVRMSEVEVEEENIIGAEIYGKRRSTRKDDNKQYQNDDEQMEHAESSTAANAGNSSERREVREGDKAVEDVIPMDDVRTAAREAMGQMQEENASEGTEDEEDESATDGSSDAGEDDEDDDVDNDHSDIFAAHRTSMFQRRRMRESCGSNIPCGSHIRQYRGHCNVQTVKDVNFYGLNDEFVVSGSDSGHIFIWERKTSRLVNILEGDREVVNVVQGEYLSKI